MHLVRCSRSSRWAVRAEGADSALPAGFSLGEALSADLGHFRELLDRASEPLDEVTPAAPVDADTEVWAAGVTYRLSREARVEESTEPDIYQRVYDAERPELFFKSIGRRVRGHGQSIGVRPDSTWDVPEPELAVVVTASGEIAGYTVCDDVSSRSIEGENPLYLPQAKMYAGATALGPGIRPAWEVPDPYDLAIEMSISRGGVVAWSGAASTSQLHRRLDDLVGHLFRADRHPQGVILSTGTCLVPGQEFTLTPGDQVEIRIEGIGTLANDVLPALEIA
ncbi:fumarylacetoacetate hydrolase family protein [Nonomuraea sp. LPB2021202275-12-8]|uniref:fumarylacetoacetate hydrolase family protein n=1 Tax=Nonomuraea sp. LPB2021202275-12-8 TaxID=3120159 RepID=UPI00300C12B4